MTKDRIHIVLKEQLSEIPHSELEKLASILENFNYHELAFLRQAVNTILWEMIEKMQKENSRHNEKS